MWVAEWKGVRRGVADCGCGRAREDGANSITSVTVPIRVRREIQGYAKRNGLSFSRAIRDLVEAGLAWEAFVEYGDGGGGGGAVDGEPADVRATDAEG